MRRSSVLVVLTLCGLLIRSLRLEWQPLWWDEGYSVFVATEHLADILWLTAHDIHPPLYYALLHFWIRASHWLPGLPHYVSIAPPLVLRTLSILIGVLTLPLIAWLAHLLFPKRPRIPALLLFLICINPMHIFYSQEVRMYNLALALGVASTIFLWKYMIAIESTGKVLYSKRNVLWLGSYILATTLALYTLYYSALLFLAHLLWSIWYYRYTLRKIWPICISQFIVFLLYLPWLTYATPLLLNYIKDKVASDNDVALGSFTYLFRHLLAFSAGHIVPESLPLRLFTYIGIIALLWLTISVRRKPPATTYHPQFALVFFLLIPSIIGFLLNILFPFFPEGGERLLFFTLPYFLMLVASEIDHQWHWRVGKPVLLGLLIAAISGTITFYHTPRYVEDDYRPLISQVVEQGTDQDTFLAIFPWQVGYWRAYAPVRVTKNLDTESTEIVQSKQRLNRVQHGPHPRLLSSTSLEWGEDVRNQIDHVLTLGTVWFPAPLSFGSDLPAQIEHYIQSRTTPSDQGAQQFRAGNLENRWYSATTRLSAWRQMPIPSIHPQNIAYETVQLVGAGVAPAQLASANQVLAAALAWQLPMTPDEDKATPNKQHDLRVTLRLSDSSGRTWASRDYGPPGSLAIPIEETSEAVEQSGIDQAVIDHISLLVPAGLPPDTYTVEIGIRKLSTNGTGELIEIENHGQLRQLIPIGQVQITQPEVGIPPIRLPIQTWLSTPSITDGMTLWGYSSLPNHVNNRSVEVASLASEQGVMAGTVLPLTLFLQNQSAAPPARQLYVSLLDETGAGVAGLEGWPFPDYPTTMWPQGALLQAPLQVNLPATLASDEYELIVGWVDPITGAKSPPTVLDNVPIWQRQAQFEQPTIQYELEKSVQFGSHVRLLGYDLSVQDNASIRKEQSYTEQQIALRLHWQVIQPLLPAHHIFIHLTQPEGALIAQEDGPPLAFVSDTSEVSDMTVQTAPTGSWQPDEYLTTVHEIWVPPQHTLDLGNPMWPNGEDENSEKILLYAGLYFPTTGIRLPASIEGQPGGDKVLLVVFP